MCYLRCKCSNFGTFRNNNSSVCSIKQFHRNNVLNRSNTNKCMTLPLTMQDYDVYIRNGHMDINKVQKWNQTQQPQILGTKQIAVLLTNL